MIDCATEDLIDKPSVAVIEWVDPLMAGGNWMPTLVEMAGGREFVWQGGIAFALDEFRRVTGGGSRCDCDRALRFRHRADEGRCSDTRIEAGLE